MRARRSDNLQIAYGKHNLKIAQQQVHTHGCKRINVDLYLIPYKTKCKIDENLPWDNSTYKIRRKQQGRSSEH